MEFLKLKHSMPAGDLLSLLPGLKHMWEQTGKKWIIYQRLNLSYGDMYGAYEGANYSIKDKDGMPVTMNNAVFEALRPLLLDQEYIEGFYGWLGEKVDYDMDLLRQQDTTMPYGAINRWPFYLWPEMTCDLSQPFLSIKETSYYPFEVYRGSIVINRTERYNNMFISYNFLKEYSSAYIYFIGLKHEYELFRKNNDLDVEWIPTKNYLDIGQLLNGCKFFIGNQSSIFQVAEGLKIPRILEVCKPIPNVIGSGPDFYDFINQKSLEYLVNKLYE